MIVSSFQSEYGVRIYSQEFQQMKWDEFSALLSGLSGDSPLGRIVQIRLENDKNVLKHFTSQQIKIRSLWRSRNAERISEKDCDLAMEQLKCLFLEMALGGED